MSVTVPLPPPPPPPPPADTTAPSAVGSLTATVANKRTVSVTWSRATDDVGVVGYRFGRDRRRRRGPHGTSWSRKLPAGSHTFTVRALDAPAGNVSTAASASLVVR